jgi:uncharacterized SAM-binding protein YcdF (DUF218 family)
MLQQKKIRKLVLSDVVYSEVSETQQLENFLKEEGIKKEQYAVHGRVINSLEEAQSVKRYCTQHGVKTILLITSADHMRRAAALFRKQGLSPDLLSSSRPDMSREWEDYVPCREGLNATYWLLYETVGYLGYRVTGKI